MISSQLLDKNTEAYVIKKYQIQDENHKTLGLIKFKTGLRGEEYRLIDSSGSILIKIRSKSFFGKSYFVEDNSKKIIGLVKDFNSYYILEDKSRNIFLCGEQRTEHNRFEITDEKEKLVASFSMVKTGSKKQRLFGSWNDQFVLHIHDLSLDRKILLGFFVFVYYRTLSHEGPSWKDGVNAGSNVGG